MNRARASLVLVLTVCFFHSTASAQSVYATIVGAVTDPTSAVIRGAKVTVANVRTNEKRQVESNDAGNYEITNLFAGLYVLEAEMPGFAKYRRERIELSPDQQARVDVAMEVSTQATQVTVTAEAGTPIETESAALSDLRSFQQLTTLPLATRSIYRYLVLTPGVTGGMNGTMSVSGSRNRQVHYAVDGVTMSDVRSSNTIGPTLNFIEAFEEFKIDFGNNSAEFKAVGTLNVVTKRGGNQLHGGIYDYYSTGAFRARNYFTRSRSGTPSHGFGGSISGPAYFPKLYDGRDKTFWFGSYETTFAPQDVSNLTPSVPLAAWKRGDFSGAGTVVRDPFAGNQPFPGGIIPSTRINNVAKQYLPFWPDPNFGDPTVFANQNYREQKRRPFSKPHNFQTRLDHRFSERNTIFGRYLHQRQQNPDFESNLPGTLGMHEQLRVVKHFLLSDTHVFTPALINEFRFGISFNTNPQTAASIDGPAFIRAAGLTNVTRTGDLPPVKQLPIVSFSQGAGIQTIEVTNQRFFNEDLTLQWQDTVSKITSKHSLRIGFEVNQRKFKDQNQPTNVFGNFQFTNRYTGFNFADFLLGTPSTISRAPFAEQREDRSIAYDWFLHDSYKITNRLTLTLGVRYELHPGWTTSGDRISAFDEKTGSIVVPDSALKLVSPVFPINLIPVIGASKTGFNDRLFPTDWNNFAPRVGFAWRPRSSNRFVIRGGYGIFYDIIPRQTSLFGTPFVVSEPSHTNPADINDPLFVQWPLAFPRIDRAAGVSVPTTFPNDFRTPYAQNWNLTLEKELAGMRLRGSYVGTGGRKMPFAFNINQPIPGPGLFLNKPRRFPNLPGITQQINGGSHTYHAFNAEIERHFSNGLMFESAFTFAKDLGDEDVGLENTYDRRRERAQTQIQPYRRWVGFFIYELPLGKGKRFGSNLGGLSQRILGGWEISASAAMQDGQNETPLWQTADIHGIAFTTSQTPAQVMFRPDCLADPNFPSDRQSINAWYDVTVFRLPTTPGLFGNCGRGIIHGPAVRVLHGGMFKRFRLGERFSFRAGAEATNILNHPNWGNLSSSALRLDNTSARARITNASGATSGSAGDAPGSRVMRLDLRIEF